MKNRMQYRRSSRLDPLTPCRVCGMDAGVRKVTEKVPEQFFVVCECCGFKTKPHTTQGAATQEWKGRSAENG